VLSTDSRCGIFDVEALLNVTEDLNEFKPNRTIKLKDRLTSMAISDFSSNEHSSKMLGKKRRKPSEEKEEKSTTKHQKKSD
jgi:hypothetical protein